MLLALLLILPTFVLANEGYPFRQPVFNRGHSERLVDLFHLSGQLQAGKGEDRASVPLDAFFESVVYLKILDVNAQQEPTRVSMTVPWAFFSDGDGLVQTQAFHGGHYTLTRVDKGWALQQPHELDPRAEGALIALLLGRLGDFPLMRHLVSAELFHEKSAVPLDKSRAHTVASILGQPGTWLSGESHLDISTTRQKERYQVNIDGSISWLHTFFQDTQGKITYQLHWQDQVRPDPYYLLETTRKAAIHIESARKDQATPLSGGGTFLTRRQLQPKLAGFDLSNETPSPEALRQAHALMRMGGIETMAFAVLPVVDRAAVNTDWKLLDHKQEVFDPKHVRNKMARQLALRYTASELKDWTEWLGSSGVAAFFARMEEVIDPSGRPTLKQFQARLGKDPDAYAQKMEQVDDLIEQTRFSHHFAGIYYAVVDAFYALARQETGTPPDLAGKDTLLDELNQELNTILMACGLYARDPMNQKDWKTLFDALTHQRGSRLFLLQQQVCRGAFSALAAEARPKAR